MHWWDKIRFKSQNPKNWIKKRKNHFWSGISLLIFKYGVADQPIRIRLNFITIFFSILIIIALPAINIANLISQKWQQDDDINNLQSRVLMTLHLKANLNEKKKFLELIKGQLLMYQEYSTQGDQTIINKIFSGQSDFLTNSKSNQITGQKHYNLELFRQLHNHGKFLFKQNSYHSLHAIWHRLTLYHAMPRGRPLLAGAGMITSGFGRRENPTENSGHEFHTGVDFGDAPGTPLIATASGIIYKANEDPTQGYGNHVRIHHGFGITTTYAHCQSLAVTQGEFVKKGQVVGFLGKTGRTTGHHIHYEVAYGNELATNPLEFIQIR